MVWCSLTSINTAKINSGANLIPHVPDIGQCEVSFIHVGASNYRRQYRIFTTNSDSVRHTPLEPKTTLLQRFRFVFAVRWLHPVQHCDARTLCPMCVILTRLFARHWQVYKQDYTSEIFFKTEPDVAGNVCSPIATVFQSASFISALEELALQAEVVRARQMLVTQPMSRVQGNQNLDPVNLFFDSESRAVQASATAEDDVNQASSLAMQAKMMQIINRLQTTDPTTGRERPNNTVSTGGVAGAVPPPVPPQLFAAPDRQQVVPGVRPPEARSDLVELMRVVNDHSESTTTQTHNNNHALSPNNTSPAMRSVRQSPLPWACRQVSS